VVGHSAEPGYHLSRQANLPGCCIVKDIGDDSLPLHAMYGMLEIGMRSFARSELAA